MGQQSNIAALVLTHNEELNLHACLRAISWVDDVLVLDSFSSDATVEIAKCEGARVLQNRFHDFASQRNFGIENGQFKQEWLLHLDADEIVTADLRDELLSVTSKGEKDAYQVASKMMFEGRWLKHAGLYPCYQVRLGRTNILRFHQAGHGQREDLSRERIGTLRNALIHHSFSKGIAHWIERHNRYSTDEAEHFLESKQPIDWAGVLSMGDRSRRGRALKQVLGHLPFRPALRFLYMYLWRRGFLDGRAGLTYCCLLAIYEYFIVLKIREQQRGSAGRQP